MIMVLRRVGLPPPLSFGHLPQIRQVKFGLRIEQLNHRIWGRLGDGHFSANENGLGRNVHETVCVYSSYAFKKSSLEIPD